MTQGSLPIVRSGQYSQKVCATDKGIVAVDCFGGQELVLRFLPKNNWGQQAKEVRMDFDLARELKKLLEEELDQNN